MGIDLTALVVEFAQSRVDWVAQMERAIGLSAAVLAGVAFVVSVAPQATTWRRQLAISLVLGVPALAYANAMQWGVSANAFYYAVVMLALIAALLLLWVWHQEITPYVVCIGLSLVVLAGLVSWNISSGHLDYGVHVFLAGLSFFAAGLYWYHFRRRPPESCRRSSASSPGD